MFYVNRCTSQVRSATDTFSMMPSMRGIVGRDFCIWLGPANEFTYPEVIAQVTLAQQISHHQPMNQQVLHGLDRLGAGVLYKELRQGSLSSAKALSVREAKDGYAQRLSTRAFRLLLLMLPDLGPFPSLP